MWQTMERLAIVSEEQRSRASIFNDDVRYWDGMNRQNANQVADHGNLWGKAARMAELTLISSLTLERRSFRCTMKDSNHPGHADSSLTIPSNPFGLLPFPPMSLYRGVTAAR